MTIVQIVLVLFSNSIYIENEYYYHVIIRLGLIPQESFGARTHLYLIILFVIKSGFRPIHRQSLSSPHDDTGKQNNRAFCNIEDCMTVQAQ